MADDASEEILDSASESQRRLDTIRSHHEAAEGHADNAEELSSSGSPFDVIDAFAEMAKADVSNDQANRVADELQAKVGPNHTVNGDGSITLNKLSPDGQRFDLDQSFSDDAIASSTGLSPRDVALAGPGAKQGARDKVSEQEAADAELAKKNYLDGLLAEAGVDPTKATPAQIDQVIQKEEYRQNGVLDMIKAKGGNPDSMSPEELDKAAERAVTEREEELKKEVGDNAFPQEPPPAPDGATFDGPQPDGPEDKDGNEFGGFFDGPGPDRGDGNADKGKPPEDGPGDPPDGDEKAPVGGDPIDGGPPPDPKNGGDRQQPGGDGDKPKPDAGGGGGGEPQPDGAGKDPGGEPNGGGDGGGGPAPDDPDFDPSDYDDFESDPVAGGTFPTTDGGEVTGKAYADTDGDYYVVGDDGTTYGVTEAYAEGIDALPETEEEPIEQFTAPNRHADDPVVAEMIQQEHEAKRGADIDYGDGESGLGTSGYKDIRPDQIDYGGAQAAPADDLDHLVEAPDADVIDPAEADASAFGTGAGPATSRASMAAEEAPAGADSHAGSSMLDAELGTEEGVPVYEADAGLDLVDDEGQTPLATDDGAGSYEVDAEIDDPSDLEIIE